MLYLSPDIKAFIATARATWKASTDGNLVGTATNLSDESLLNFLALHGAQWGQPTWQAKASDYLTHPPSDPATTTPVATTDHIVATTPTPWHQLAAWVELHKPLAVGIGLGGLVLLSQGGGSTRFKKSGGLFS